MRHALIAALLGATILAGCGMDDDEGVPAPAAAASTTKIDIKDFKYSPTPATVKSGETVTVPNADNAPHTLTASTSKSDFDSGTIKGNESGSVTFTKAGKYTYFCEFHPYMKGSVTVTG